MMGPLSLRVMLLGGSGTPCGNNFQSNKDTHPCQVLFPGAVGPLPCGMTLDEVVEALFSAGR